MSNEAPAPVSPLRHFLRLTLAYWKSRQKTRIRGAVLLLVLLTKAQVALAIWISYWNRELFDALERHDVKELATLVGTFALIFILTMLVTALHLYLKRWLQLDWRRWLTRRLLDSWLTRHRHYHLQFASGDHDNPDGRVAEDIRIATESALTLALSLLYSILVLGSFIEILLEVSGSLPLPLLGIEIPAYMVLLAFVYASVGAIFGQLLGSPLVNATNRLQTAEADLRFGLARTRENSEAIALLQGEEHEHQHVESLFQNVRRSWNCQTLGFIGIVSFSTGYGTLLPVFPILIAAPQFIIGMMTLGVLMQAAQAFQRLTSALSWPIDNLGELARCRASIDRVMSLYEDMQELAVRGEFCGTHCIQLHHSTNHSLEVVDLHLATPEGRLLLEPLNLSIQPGERLLIHGDPSVTSVLFKTLAGLWPWGRGEILLPTGKSPLFLPQRPFLPKGTLQAALSYPQPPEHFSTAHYEKALTCAGLTWLSSRLNESADWRHALPLRDQQRLGVVRLMLHQPTWIVIEEAADSFDNSEGGCVPGLLADDLEGVTVITISSRQEINAHYQRHIQLHPVTEERYLNGIQALSGSPRKG